MAETSTFNINNETNSSSSLIKKCSLFDFKQSKSLLLNIKEIIEGFHENENNETSTKSESALNLNEIKIQLDEIETIKKCTICQFSFTSREEQIDHYKCDLHLFNMKQKLKGKQPVTADEFEQLIDISSISGSDSDNDSDDENVKYSESTTTSSSENESVSYARIARNKPKISFKLQDSTVLVIQRCVLHAKKNFPEDQKTLLDMVKSISQDDYWCIILVAAGHFAAAIFKGETVVCHKTFHRYVVRAKRGTVQSQHDSSGKHAKSTGANIRRSQEAAFKDDMRLLLCTQWKSDLDKCKCIFIRVPSYNQHVLISSTASHQFSSASNQSDQTVPFKKSDTRLRHIPFMTFRPTFNEVKRTHTLLAKIELYNSSYLKSENKQQINKSIDSQQNKKLQLLNKDKKSKATTTSTAKQPSLINKQAQEPIKEPESISSNSENETTDITSLNKQEQPGPECITTQNDFIQSLSEDQLKLFNELYTACFTNNNTKLEQLFQTNPMDITANNNLINKRLNKDKGLTLLHLSSELGYSDIVWTLLKNGADPALSDLTKQRRLPYFVATRKETRDKYRRFMHDYPDKYDFKLAKIPAPLSEAQANEKSEKEKEKKRQQRKMKKQRETLTKQQQKQLDLEANEKQRFLALTDQEKKRLIINRNMLNVVPSNSSASNPIDIKIISRCWFCAADMSTSVPFEYFDYKFCSTKCLKAHRDKQQQQQQKK